MIKYFICSGKSIQELQTNVDFYIEKGFRPKDGICQHNRYLLQPMIKKTDK